jgi:hypothetical protein
VSRFLRVGALMTAAAGLVLSSAMPAFAATIPAAGAARPAAAAGPGVSIKATSPFAPVRGDVYVAYLDGGDGTALITGQITGARAGEVIRLYAQSFPFSRAATREQTQVLQSGGTVPYTFSVQPRVATRFTVKLFRSRQAATPLAQSTPRPVYVADGGSASRPARCGRPVCRQAIHVTIRLPQSAVPTEMAKHWYVYLTVKLGRPGGKNPSAPTWLYLDGQASQSAVTRLSPTSYKLTISFSFRIGNHRYSYGWTACTKDTETTDGIGLPRHHGCGDPKVRASTAYLG